MFLGSARREVENKFKEFGMQRICSIIDNRIAQNANGKEFQKHLTTIEKIYGFRNAPESQVQGVNPAKHAALEILKKRGHRGR